MTKKPFAATEDSQPREPELTTFLDILLKKVANFAPEAAILPLEAAKNAVFGKKEQKAALRKKKSRAGIRTWDLPAASRATLPTELDCSLAFKPFAATEDSQPRELELTTFLDILLKKVANFAPEAAILPLGAAGRPFSRQKIQKKGL